MAPLALILVVTGVGCERYTPPEWHEGNGYRWHELSVPVRGGPGFTLLSPRRTGVRFQNELDPEFRLTVEEGDSVVIAPELREHFRLEDLDGYEDLLVVNGHGRDMQNADALDRILQLRGRISWREAKCISPELETPNLAFRLRPAPCPSRGSSPQPLPTSTGTAGWSTASGWGPPGRSRAVRGTGP